MYFREMRYVYEVYRHSSFSKAAQALSVAQPTLSLMIKKAETRLGGEIFDRSRPSLALTDLGRAYLHAAIRLIRIEDDFEQYLHTYEQCPSGTIVIGATPLFASYVLPPLLSAFSSRHSGVEIQLHEKPTAALEKDLREGTVDLIMDNAMLDDACFESFVFQEEEVILALPRKTAETSALRLYRMTSSYIQRGGIQGAAAVPLKLLSDLPFILLKEGTDTRSRSDKLCLEAGFAPKVLFQADHQITAYNMAASGLGAAFISDTLVNSIPHDERLMFFRLSGANARRNICFYRRRSQPVSTPVAAFLKLFQNYNPSSEN